jgi:hypothetical protein
MQGIAGRQHSPSYFHSASFEHQIIFASFHENTLNKTVDAKTGAT